MRQTFVNTFSHTPVFGHDLMFPSHRKKLPLQYFNINYEDNKLINIKSV